MTKRWYVIRTKPQSENIAAIALQTNGFDFFYPVVQVPDQKSGRKKTPLFPGYMFLRHDAEGGEWPSLNQLSGILGWMRVGDEVPPVPDDIVSDLSQRVDSIDRDGGLWNKFRSGQTVRVVSGNIEGLAKVIEEPHSPEARVRVLLDFMGRQIQAQVPWHNLQPTSQDNEHTENHKKPRRTRGRGRWIRGFAPPVSVGSQHL